MAYTYLYEYYVPTKKIEKISHFVNFNDFLEHFDE